MHPYLVGFVVIAGLSVLGFISPDRRARNAFLWTAVGASLCLIAIVLAGRPTCHAAFLSNGWPEGR